MAEDAYRIIAATLIAHAPAPFEHIEAQFRLHESMFQSQCTAVKADGKHAGFSVRAPESDKLKAALRSLQASLPHGEGPAFTRADFRLDANGSFSFDAYYAEQLAARLVEVLRQDWPAGVQRLRLVARIEPGDENGWRLDYYDLSHGQARALSRPRARPDLDAPRWLISDLAEAYGGQRGELVVELTRDGDYELTINGKPQPTAH